MATLEDGLGKLRGLGLLVHTMAVHGCDFFVVQL